MAFSAKRESSGQSVALLCRPEMSDRASFHANYERAMLHAKLQAATYENKMLKKLVKQLLQEKDGETPAAASTKVDKVKKEVPQVVKPSPKEDFSNIVFTHEDFANCDEEEEEDAYYDDEEYGYYDEDGEYHYYEDEDEAEEVEEQSEPGDVDGGLLGDGYLMKEYEKAIRGNSGN